MKWGIILILCILLSLNYASAEDITLGVGESYEKGGVRITLSRIDDNYEKVVLCVNNEELMINEDQSKRFKNADLEVEHIDKKYRTAEIDIGWINSCVGCKCENDCLNDMCNIQMEDEFGNPTKIEETIEEPVEENNIETDTEPVEEYNKSNYVLIASIPLIGILIGIVLVWLLWFRKMPF